MKKGFSSSSSICVSALLTISVGSSVWAIWVRYAKASLFSWYPAWIVVSTAFWSLSVSVTLWVLRFGVAVCCFGFSASRELLLVCVIRILFDEVFSMGLIC